MNTKRIAAGFIDFLIAALIQSFLMFFFIMKPLMTQQIEADEIILINLQITYISMIYMVIRDLLGSRSIGKRIIKLKIVNIDSKDQVSFSKLFLRNITWLLGPIEIIVYFIYGSRIGDKIAKTSVVDGDVNRTSG